MFHKTLPIFIISSILILVFSSLTSTKQWFFFKSGQHDIYKTGLSGEYLRGASLAQYENENLPVPPSPEDNNQVASILGETNNDNKRIEIDLSGQKLYAYEGETLVFNFTISSGKPWWATPTGEFRTWIKLRYQRMRGG